MYIHEHAIRMAMGRLGGPDRKDLPPEATGLGGFGGAVGGAIRGAMSKPHGPSEVDREQDMRRAIMSSAIQNAQGQREALDREQFNGVAASPGLASLQRAEQNLKTNDMANQTRLGGRFTPEGLVNASQEAELNGQDRLRARSMIGVGGTLVPHWEQ